MISRSHIYDNWEKLVGSVLRRDHDRQLALCDSTSDDSTSIHSCFSSSFSSQFDDFHYNSFVPAEESRSIPIDHSDLVLDHQAWKAMLPPGQQEILYKSASMKFFLDHTTRKNCFLLGLGAMRLLYSEGNWDTIRDERSRFLKILRPRPVSSNSEDVDVGGLINMKMLSPKTLYAGYLVFRLENNERIPDVLCLTSATKIFFPGKILDYSQVQKRVIRLDLCKDRPDGCKEVELGNFHVHEESKAEVQVGAQIANYSRASRVFGLIVVGIEFRPSEIPPQVFSRQEETPLDDSHIYDNWEKMVGVVLRRDHGRELALCDSSEESRSIPIDYSDLVLDHQAWKAMLPPGQQEILYKSASMRFFLDARTRKNCFLLGVMSLLCSEGNWFLEPHKNSRFLEVLEANKNSSNTQDLEVGGLINMKMLSPKTLYAGYLVFGLETNKTTPHPCLAISTVEIFDTQIHKCTIGLEHGKDRPDGWKEVELGNFLVRDGWKTEVHLGARIVNPFIASSSWVKDLVVEGIEFRPLETPPQLLSTVQETSSWETYNTLIESHDELQLMEPPTDSWRFQKGR